MSDGIPGRYQTGSGCEIGRVHSHFWGAIRFMQRSVNILALVKDSERFVFLYDEDSGEELLDTLGKYAADEELSFSWHDAAMLSQRVRRLQLQSHAEVEHGSPELPR